MVSNGANALFDAISVNNGDAAAVQQWNTALAAVTQAGSGADDQ